MKIITKRIVACFVAAVMLTGVFLVGQPAERVEAKTQISKTKASICVGEKLTLKVTGTTKKVTWKSSKKGTATVSSNGVVTAKKKGSCVITATCGGKDYKCKLTVKKLPKDYATINGKKVKIGSKVKITYTVACDTPLDDVSGRYYYYGDQLKILTPSDDKMRFKTWVWINGDENVPPGDDYKSQYKNMVKGKEPLASFYQCWGTNPKDLYNSYPVSCKNGKEFDSFYVKALKSGNFTFKATFEAWNKGKKITKFKTTEKMK